MTRAALALALRPAGTGRPLAAPGARPLPVAALASMLPLLASLLLGGCERAKQDMYDQPKYKPYAASPQFDDGLAGRTAPAGAVPQARGAFAGSSSGRLGREAVLRDQQAAQAQAIPYPIDMALLRRGQERYTIYCTPCHSRAGDGDGYIVRRGFPAPPSYHIARLRDASDRHLFEVISNGYGIMYPYGDRVEPADRWAIVAYIRALQLSQHAEAAALPAAVRARLPAGGRP
ncbi:c-type cytochrome [Massilia forsythiae]|nr:cytochrome c [Massilia forsythiae]